MKRIFSSCLLLSWWAASLTAAVDPEAVRLRNLGLAELENEQPGKAQAHFEKLARLVADDPLPQANLAIAALRQQEYDAAIAAIDKALRLAPERPDLLAIKGEILQWSGRPDAALPVLRTAAKAAPKDVEIQYALLRQASTASGEEADRARAEALERLRQLRPENLVVLLQSGQLELAAGDRVAATDRFLRIKEVLWQAPAAAMKVMDQVLAALEADDLEAARVPALRLENVVKITPMFKEGLRELSPGIQGIPVVRFRSEPPARAFGEPLRVRFAGDRISERPTSAASLVRGDFDGDQTTDWARLIDDPSAAIEVWIGGEPSSTLPAAGLQSLAVADIDNDGSLDLIGVGPKTLRILRGRGDGTFEDATTALGVGSGSGSALAVLDFDIEGDLDLVTAGASLELYRNSLRGPLEAIGERSLPSLEIPKARDLLASDLDRDGDVDLLLAHAEGLVWLDNLRQGQFADRTRKGGLESVPGAHAVASADLDNDGLPDLIAVGEETVVLRNRGGEFAPSPIGATLESPATFTAVRAFDANNDGRLDLALGGPTGLAIAIQNADGAFEFASLERPPASATALLDLDTDQDCDLDLLVGSDQGLWRLENEGGDGNHCLVVALQGLDRGNSKNNRFGLGSTIEVRFEDAYQFREVDTDTTHLGLGQLPHADLLRVVWTNGVPQNRLRPQVRQRIVEEQVLKGSCPFVYAAQPDGVHFVTDLLWGAPIGLPVAPGRWATSDPQELVALPTVEPNGEAYDLRVTEELWEAAFFDYVRLWVVDHPHDVEVASSLRIVPGRQTPEQVVATRGLRPPAAATVDGVDVTHLLIERDETYASPWRESAYQGVSAAPWSLVLDLGESPGTPVRLHLDGWIFPTDASLNLALAQQEQLEIWPPRLEVETADGWQPLVAEMGFPAGKTKTMVVDVPALPAASTRLRIVGTQWLSFDRIAWSTEIADDTPRLRAKLRADTAELRYRGFSKMYRPAPNGPHYFDYAELQTESPWLPFPGRYTRYGDVTVLLEEADDRSVILAPGDEMRLLFKAQGLPPVPDGWRRSVFLESHGWDKDADRNTGAGQQVEPLPFRAMSTYPYQPPETFPDTDLLRAYRDVWLTREVGSAPGAKAVSEAP